MTSSSEGRLLRIAIPNKGSLSASASDMLREAGYHFAHPELEPALRDVRARR